MVQSTILAHIIMQPPPCCLLLATDTSELNKIHPLTHLSGPSNVSQDSFVKITLESSFSCISWPNFDALEYLLL